MNNAYDELSFNHVMKSCIKKYKYFIYAVILSACLMGGYLLMTTIIKPAYLTNSVVLIYPKETSVETSTYVTDGKLDPINLASLKEGAGSYINLINNRWVIYKVLDNLGIHLEDAEEFITENVTVTNIGESPYLNIEIKFSNAQTSYQINQEIINVMPGILEDLNMDANFTVISYPVVPMKPDIFSKTILIVAGAGCVVLLWFLLVLFSELFYSTFRTEKDVKRILDIEIIGCLPSIQSKSKKHTLLNNALKNLCAYMVLSQNRVFAITGEVPNQQYNAAVQNISQQLASLEYTVLFVDFLDPPNHDSTRTVSSLRTHKNITYMNIAKNQSLTAPGSVANQIHTLLDKEKGAYNFVLLNLPPVSTMFHSVECYGLADMAILLLRHDSTKQENAKSLLDLIKKSPVKNICCILYDIKCTGVFNDYSEFVR